MDKLEKQIIENRSDLDRYEPDPTIWQRIQHNRKNRSIKPGKIIGWAAALAVIVTSSLILLSHGEEGMISFRSSKNVPDEFLETEYYYSARINSLIEEAKPLLTSNPGIGQDLMIEIADLDSLYLEIRKDLKENVSNDEVIEALIMNYRVKIQILEEMLNILNQDNANDEKKNSYEI